VKPTGLFPAPAAWFSGAHLAKVVSVQDPASLGRVQVQLLGADPDGDAPIWARVAVPFAGDNYGAYLIPDVGAEVLVLFASNDPDHPIVIGNLWNGATALPESRGDKIDRWVLWGKNGTSIAIVEESAGQETVEISTPGGASATLTDGSGGEIVLEVGSNTITMSSSGVEIQTGSKCSITASSVSVSAGSVKVDAGMSTFSGTVKCDTLISNSVVSSSYTPGAGNVW
jgi:uncharacterized protein involved in type VI secretion and phage assembly